MYYIVCQGDSFFDQFRGGYIWEPVESDALVKLHVGDRILHDVKGQLCAVSTVTQEVQTATAPGCLRNKYESGHAGRIVLCDGKMSEHPILYPIEEESVLRPLSDVVGDGLMASIL